MKNFYFIFSILLFSFQFQNLSAQGENCQTAVAIMPGNITADGPSSGNGCHDCSPGTPGGIPAENADWFSYTPTESGVMDISTCGGGVDTRVWVYTGSCASLTQIAGSDDACDFAPGEPFAASIENLTVTAGTTYFIEFDDAWETSGFDFQMNFTKITTNVFVQGFELCFTQIPDNQLASNGLPLSFTVGKQGPTPQSGVFVKTEIFNTADPSTPVKSFTSPTFDLPNTPLTITSGAIEKLSVGEYFIVQTVFPQGGDEIASDNMDTSRTFLVTPRTYAVDDDNFVGNLGVNGPGRVRQGQHFYFENPDEIASVSFNIIGGNPGDSVWAEIFSVDATTGTPVNLLSTSRKILLDANDPDWIEIPFQNPFPVSTGGTTLFVSLTHMATGKNIDLGVSDEIFKPRKSWLSVENDPWIPLENIGLGEFRFAYAIRVNNSSGRRSITIQVDMRDETVTGGVVYSGLGFDDQIPSEFKQMTDAGNGIWEATYSVRILSNPEFIFVNGRPTSGGVFESVPQNCGIQNGSRLWRTEEIRFESKTLAPVCFGRCGICPIQGCSDPAYIICDDFEQYDLGDLNPQSQFWTTWDNTSGDGLVSDENPASGTRSLLIDGSLSGATQDVLLLLNDVAAGAFEIKWSQYVPTGKSAYFGAMHRNPTNDVSGHDFYFDPNGVGEIWLGNDKVADFQYPDNQWFEVLLTVDFNNDYATLSIDGVERAYVRFSDAVDVDGNALPSLGQLAGINFYPLDASYRSFVDDIFYREISAMPDANVCFDAKDINFLLSTDSIFYDENSNHTSELSDPSTGFDCFIEPGSSPKVSTSKWYEFTGDGKTYQIELGRNCTFIDTIVPLEGQLALYSGDCRNLTSISCSDTHPGDEEEIILKTVAGTTYFLMVDGYDSDQSDYCLTIQEVLVNVTFQVDMKDYLEAGNPLSSDGIFVSNDVNVPFDRFPMADNGDSTYTSTVPFPTNTRFNYFFRNGLENEPFDSLSACGNIGLGRNLEIFEEDISLDLVCWGLCEECPVSVSTKDLLGFEKIQLFPNPTGDILNLRFENISGQSADIKIFNQLGQLVFYKKEVWRILNEKIDVSTWKSGIYIVSVSNDQGDFFEKIIVE